MGSAALCLLFSIAELILIRGASAPEAPTGLLLYLTLSIHLHPGQGGPLPSTLSSRAKPRDLRFHFRLEANVPSSNPSEFRFSISANCRSLGFLPISGQA